jgi:hypothetical protein
MSRKKIYNSSGKNFSADRSSGNNFKMIQEITDLPVCADCGPAGDSNPWLTGSPQDVDPGPYGNCQLLYGTILQIQQQLETTRFTADGLAAKQAELNTAWAKWNASGCTLVAPKKSPPVLTADDAGGGGATDPKASDTGGTTDPGKGTSGQPATDPSANGNGLPFQTLSGAGGASGDSGAISNSPKHRNYFWLVVAASLAVGFVLLGKSNIAGKPL